MSSYSTRRSESSASRRSQDGDTTEDGGADDRDESKRRSRNLSEKKRRDQFNILISELSTMVSTSARKMDKSTVLKATIACLKAHNELSVQSQVQETQEDWKPSFLSNEEFTHLMLEALDGFVVVISSTGKLLYLSESITSLLGHLPGNLVNSSVYEYIPAEEKCVMYGVLSNEEKSRGSVSILINFRLGGLEMNEENEQFQLVKFVGYHKQWISSAECESETVERSEEDFSESNDSASNSCNIFIATGRLMDSDLLREMSVVVDSAKSEFSSRHSLEWKFLFLDHRAPPIIGYLPFEVLGTSGYDYYHVEDLEKVATCHEALMQKGEGTSCYYRFLTKGQQWIWLQTRFYITYHQWNSKPEFIVCTHRVVSYADVMTELSGEVGVDSNPLNEPRGSREPKHSKTDYRKSHSFSFKNSSKMKNGGSLSYGSIASKRTGQVRKLDLPPKFMTSLSTSHSAPAQPALQPTAHGSAVDAMREPPVGMEVAQGLSMPQTFNNTVTMALHPHHFVQSSLSSHQLSPAVPPGALPMATFQLKPITNSTFSISTTPGAPNLGGGHSILPSQCLLQEQLMLKHAELQRQILQQQEELRQVSEQLLVAQCGLIQRETSILIPQSIGPGDCVIPLSESGLLQHQQEQATLLQLQQGYQIQPSVVTFSDRQSLVQQQQHQRGNEGPT